MRAGERAIGRASARRVGHVQGQGTEREFCIGNLLVRIHFIIVMIRWTGIAPWEFEFPFPGSHCTSVQLRSFFEVNPLPQRSRAQRLGQTFASMSRPESGLDCLICARFARQRVPMLKGKVRLGFRVEA